MGESGQRTTALGQFSRKRKERIAEEKVLARRATYFSSDDEIHDAVDDLCAWFIKCQAGEVDQSAYSSIHLSFELKIKAAMGMMHFLEDPASQEYVELLNYWKIPPLGLVDRGTVVLELLEKLRIPGEFQGAQDIFLEFDDKVCLFDRELLLAKERRVRTKQSVSGRATARNRSDNAIRDRKLWEANLSMKQDGQERSLRVYNLSKRYNLTKTRIRQILFKFEKAKI